MTETETLLEFPCQFSIKAIGKTSIQLEAIILDIIRRHCPYPETVTLKERESSKGRYTATTITIEATSKQQLDAIYQDLSDCPEIMMAL